MAITYSPVFDAGTYSQRLQAFMQAVEGVVYPAYVDTVGVPTIGWGFAMNNLRTVAAGRTYIYQTVLGVDPTRIVVPSSSSPNYAAQLSALRHGNHISSHDERKWSESIT